MHSYQFCYIQYLNGILLFLIFHPIGKHGVAERTSGCDIIGSCCKCLIGTFKIHTVGTLLFLFEHLSATTELLREVT